MIDGVINIRKESGFTSHDVVAVLRGVLHQKKIGHTGTLDPAAEGVLPVCLGRATKACDMLTDWDKCYETRLILGVETDTQDTTGKVLHTSAQEVLSGVTEDMVLKAAKTFLGEQDQIPPMYSAKKIDGKRLYDLAREGVVVERKPCRITVYELEVLDISLPHVTMRIRCSKGTYIRTICHDLGQKLGCGAAMEQLVRTKVGQFQIDSALTLQQVRELVEQKEQIPITPVDQIFAHYKPVYLSEEFDKALHNGGSIPVETIPENSREKQVRFYDSAGTFIGLYTRKGSFYKLEKMFYNING